MREALNGRPAAQRTRREYQRVINAYRRVYYGSPTSTKADPSVVAVGRTAAEMGRRFDDDKILRSAIGQYEFLRREYPGSNDRFDALFTIGEIYKDDLNDSAAGASGVRGISAALSPQPSGGRGPQGAGRTGAAGRPEIKGRGRLGRRLPDAPKARRQAQTRRDVDDFAALKNAAHKPTTANGSRKLAHVTGIRHWSTPDYTRVAIDLEQDVKFESQRIDHPDRIFFDLLRHQLWLRRLLGKTFDVDDGLLKKIRVAQFQPGKTRIVLEVDDLSDYDTFLLPNPPRLIIDIHSKDIHRQRAGQERSCQGPNGWRQRTWNPRRSPTASSISTGSQAARTTAPGKPAHCRSGSTPVKKIVVDADDDDDSSRHRREARSAGRSSRKRRAATTLTPAYAAKGSSRNKSKPPAELHRMSARLSRPPVATAR